MASAIGRAPSGGRKTTISPDHLADLWNNAQRRMTEGKLDDAVARLYRLTEMVAQYVLDSKYGIDSSNVDIAALPAELSASVRKKLEAMAVGIDDQGNRTTKKVQLGLRDDYEVLAGLGHAIGPLLPPFGAKPTRLGQLLDTRNASILAHGSTPISADDARALADEVRTVTVLAMSDFDQRCAQLQFPWLAAEA
jgi:CRISPR-associated protein (TIGR02710 family)